MSNQQLMTVDEARFMPALSLDQAIVRRDVLVRFVQEIMVRDTDYGIIPGTPRPTLLKPGAERLCSFFGLTPDFEVVKEVEDWAGEEPLFYYRYKCRLLRDGRVVGDGEGSCNSREGKYRWRTADRTCPHCQKPAIRKSKKEPGWYCWSKIGGCGATWSDDNEPAIVNQNAGRIPNPDIFDQVNTIQKMAQKRAFISATLIAVNASEFFTQDVDDMQPLAPQAPPPPPPIDTELVTSLRDELASARDRLRTIGGEPRPIGKKTVEAMDARTLTEELTATSLAAWQLTLARLAESAGHVSDNAELPL